MRLFCCSSAPLVMGVVLVMDFGKTRADALYFRITMVNVSQCFYVQRTIRRKTVHTEKVLSCHKPPIIILECLSCAFLHWLKLIHSSTYYSIVTLNVTF